MIEFQCEACDKRVKVGDESAGKRGECPYCHAVLTVPSADFVVIKPAGKSSLFDDWKNKSTDGELDEASDAEDESNQGAPGGNHRLMLVGIGIVAAAVLGSRMSAIPIYTGIALWIGCVLCLMPTLREGWWRFWGLAFEEPIEMFGFVVVFGLIGAALIGWGMVNVEKSATYAGAEGRYISQQSPTMEGTEVGGVGKNDPYTAILRGDGDAIPAGVSQSAMDRLVKLASVHDSDGIAQMVLAGQAYMIPDGTRVRIISPTWKPWGSEEVRIQEGRLMGKEVFVLSVAICSRAGDDYTPRAIGADGVAVAICSRAGDDYTEYHIDQSSTSVAICSRAGDDYTGLDAFAGHGLVAICSRAGDDYTRNAGQGTSSRVAICSRAGDDYTNPPQLSSCERVAICSRAGDDYTHRGSVARCRPVAICSRAGDDYTEDRIATLVPVLRFARGLGTITLEGGVNVFGALLRFARGLGTITLAITRVLPPCCCDLLAGWGRLHCDRRQRREPLVAICSRAGDDYTLSGVRHQIYLVAICSRAGDDYTTPYALMWWLLLRFARGLGTITLTERRYRLAGLLRFARGLGTITLQSPGESYRGRLRFARGLGTITLMSPKDIKLQMLRFARGLGTITLDDDAIRKALELRFARGLGTITLASPPQPREHWLRFARGLGTITLNALLKDASLLLRFARGLGTITLHRQQR